jgi:hypothetical protein
MYFVRISEQTATFTLYLINRFVFIPEVESVYCAVRPESLYKTDVIRPQRKALGLKENRGIQNIGIEYFQGNITVDKRQVLKLRENFITEIYDRANRLENL